MKKSIIYLLLIILSLSTHKSHAQMTRKMDMNEITKSFAQDKLNKETFLRSEQSVLGNIVEPDLYYLGPGDILTYQVLPSMMTDELLIVSPDNMIVIPNYGIELQVEGMSLTDVKDEIKSKLSAINSNTKLSLSLFKPRMCFVTIEGNVNYPGTYTLPASYRISSAIKVANQVYTEKQVPIEILKNLADNSEFEKTNDQTLYGANRPTEKISSTRNVIVLHTNGSSVLADLERAQIRNDVKYDPFIMEGDNIFVPYKKNSTQHIIISGEVLRPSILEFKQGDKLSDLVKYGFGFTDKADLENIKYIDPLSGEEEFLKVTEDGELSSSDKELLPGSIIVVGRKQNRTQIETGFVEIRGEVNLPGTYIIRLGKTTIKDIIEKAGGFTDDAYLPLARINRDYDQYLTNRAQHLESSFKNSNLTLEDTVRFIANFRNKEPLVACDFVELFSQKNSTQNVILKSGDIINIPASPKQVYIFGQVNSPGYVDFESGHDASWYITRSGGFTESADFERVKIIRGKNNIWVDAGEDVQIFDGDEIYVPLPPDVPTYVQIQKYSMYVQVVVALATLANVILFIYSTLNRN